MAFSGAGHWVLAAADLKNVKIMMSNSLWSEEGNRVYENMHKLKMGGLVVQTYRLKRSSALLLLPSVIQFSRDMAYCHIGILSHLRVPLPSFNKHPCLTTRFQDYKSAPG